MKALVDACPDDAVEVPPIADRVRTLTRRTFERLAERKWTGRVIVVVLVLNGVTTIVFSALSRTGDAGIGYELSFVALAGSVAFALVCTFLGARQLVRDRERAFRRLQLAVLAYLLLTRVFEFAYNQLSATIGLLVDLVLVGIIGAELLRLRRQPVQTSIPG